MTCMKAANFLKSNVKNEKLGATVLAFLEVTDIHSINLFSSTSSAFTWTVESSRHYFFAINCAKMQRIPVGHPSFSNPPHFLGGITNHFICWRTVSILPQPFYMLENSINTFTCHFQQSFIQHYRFLCRWGPSVLRQSTGQKENYNPMNSLILPKCISCQLLAKPKPMCNRNYIISNVRNHNMEKSTLNSTMSQLDVDDNKITQDRYSKLVHFFPSIQIPTGQAGDH